MLSSLIADEAIMHTTQCLPVMYGPQKSGKEGDFSMEFLVYLESILRSKMGWCFATFFCLKSQVPSWRNNPRRSWLALQNLLSGQCFETSQLSECPWHKEFPEMVVSFLTGKSKLNHWSNKIHPGEDGDRFQRWTKNPYVSTTTYLLGAATTQPYTWQLPF